MRESSTAINDTGGMGNTASRGGVTHTFLEGNKMQGLFQMALGTRLFKQFVCKNGYMSENVHTF